MTRKYTNKRPSIPAQLERAVKVESGHQCAITNCAEHTYLEIHHIDFNRENNRQTNLILLCDKHHKMAHAGVIDRRSLRQYKDKLAAAALFAKRKTPEEFLGELKVVDIHAQENFDTEQDHPTTNIEIKIINRGEQTAFLKEIRITTLKYWSTLTDRQHSVVPVSAHYDLKIHRKIGSVSRLKVPHEVKPQETDRIVLRLQSSGDSDPSGLSIFLLKLEIIYDELDSIAAAPLIAVDIPSKYMSVASCFSGYQPGTITENKAIATEVLDLAKNKVLVSTNVAEVLESWLMAPNEAE